MVEEIAKEFEELKLDPDFLIVEPLNKFNKCMLPEKESELDDFFLLKLKEHLYINAFETKKIFLHANYRLNPTCKVDITLHSIFSLAGLKLISENLIFNQPVSIELFNSSPYRVSARKGQVLCQLRFMKVYSPEILLHFKYEKEKDKDKLQSNKTYSHEVEQATHQN